MAVKTFTTGEVLTAADTNTYLNNGGLVFVKQVTVGTGVTTVNVTSCFSTEYDNYVVSYANITSANDGIAMLCKLLVGTTVNASNFDGNTFYVVTAGAGGLTNATYTANAIAEIGSLTNVYKNASIFEVKQPNLATGTMIEFRSVDDNYYRFGAFVLKNATQYDGIQILPFNGSLTGGTITVYGYRKG